LSSNPPAHGAAYEGAIFGPFAQGPGKHPIVRASSGTIDLMNSTDWALVFRVETAAFQWGHLMITSEARAVLSVDEGGAAAVILPEFWPWAEVRVLGTFGGVGQILYEGAAGNHDAESAAFGGGEGTSPGPIVLPFPLGEVPDDLEVYARPRYGGAVGIGGFTQALTVAAVSRFRL
jgi:hypothetical protein